MILTKEQQLYLVKAWATRHRANEIARMFNERFADVLDGKQIDKRQVYAYNVDYPSNCMPNADGRPQIAEYLQEEFHRVRRIYDDHALRHHPLYQKAGRLAEKSKRHAWLKDQIENEGLSLKDFREMSREMSNLESEMADDLGQKSAVKIDISKLPTEQLIALLESGNEG